jgi:hypothetical protein
MNDKPSLLPSILLLVGQVVFGVIALLWVFLGAFDVSCVGNCKYELKGVAITVMGIAAIAIPVASTVMTVLSHARSRSSLKYPLIGSGVMVAALAISLLLEAAAINKFP